MTPDFDLSGRVAVVTGASSGIGRAIASAFAELGARVVGVARRSEALEAWSAETEGETASIAGDVSGAVAAQAICSRLSEPFGAPDILVNAAGLNTRQVADDVTTEGWNATMDVNLATPFFLAQGLVGAMKERGWGRIINIASLQSERAFPGGVAYGASKGGIVQLTRAMAEAWSSHGINANALAPGFFPTELTAAVFGDADRAARNAAQTCIGRNGELQDLIGPAVFLASPASNYVTGQVLFVDGGFTAK
ncbi:SDR family oxidoreductase [Nisaea sp.]|uniref:SDR family NAD(P)-dependent oxidoreductase n=1 Tax=Nisaea sp. TaxID=2024842 RepID=UPI0032990A16